MTSVNEFSPSRGITIESMSQVSVDSLSSRIAFHSDANSV